MDPSRIVAASAASSFAVASFVVAASSAAVASSAVVVAFACCLQTVAEVAVGGPCAVGCPVGTHSVAADYYSAAVGTHWSALTATRRIPFRRHLA